MINIRKLAWKHLGCSLYDLQDLIQKVYEQGQKDLLEENWPTEKEIHIYLNSGNVDTTLEQLEYFNSGFNSSMRFVREKLERKE